MQKSSIPEEQVLSLYTVQHLSQDAIAKIVGCHRLTVLRKLRKMGVECRDRGGKKYGDKHINNDYFANWSANMSYSLGFIAADGCVRPHKGFEVKITSIDYDLLQFFKQEFKTERDIKRRPEIRTYDLYVYSKKMISDLYKMGIVHRKTYSLEFPEVPEEFFWDFLRGYVDGDGHIEPAPNPRLCITGRKQFLDALSVLLAEKVPNYCQQKLRPAGKSKTLRISGASCDYILRKLYKNDRQSLLRKKAVALDCISYRESMNR